MTIQYDREIVFEPGQFPVSVNFRELLTPIKIGAPRFHAELEFHFILHGNGNYFVRDASYPVKSNSVLMIGSEEIHAHSLEPGAKLSKICLMLSPCIFSKSQLAGVIKRLHHIRHLRLTAKQMATVEYLLQSISHELDAKEIRHTEIILNYINCMLIILDRAAANTGHPEVNDNPLIKSAIQYIDQQFSEDISLSNMANYLGLSPCYLSSIFRRYIGLGFKEYLTQRRIIEAKKLLKSTQLKVTAIAYEVGFNSKSAFYKDFQILTGVTPNRFRINSTDASSS